MPQAPLAGVEPALRATVEGLRAISPRGSRSVVSPR